MNNKTERSSKIKGSRIASINFAEDHLIEFYEHEPGIAVITESAKIGIGSVLENNSSDKSLSETYLELASKISDKSQNNNSLKHLEEADKRVARLSKKMDKDSNSANQIPLIPRQSISNTPVTPNVELIKTQAFKGENWDWEGDAQWFLSNFFWGGGPAWVNVTGFGRHYVPETSKADFVTMNASFDGSTHVVGYVRYSTNYVFWTSYSYSLWYDSWIEPRYWKRWKYRNHVYGFKIETDGSPRYHHASSWQ